MMMMIVKEICIQWSTLTEISYLMILMTQIQLHRANDLGLDMNPNILPSPSMGK